MVQRPKPEMRSALVAAAAAELSAVGFSGMTLASVAQRAGTSVGNVYRYFGSKEDLFRAAIPDELANEVARLVLGRVEALGDATHPSALSPDHRYWTLVRDLTALSIRHRDALLFLLSQAAGTQYESYFDDRVHDLTRAALDYARRAYPRLTPRAADVRAVRRAYHAFVTGLVVTLREEGRPTALEHAIGRHTTYHLAGLKALLESLDSATERNP